MFVANTTIRRAASLLGAVVSAALIAVGSASALSEGELDDTFDSDGEAATPIGTGADVANSVAIQSDGKIVAAGYATFANRDLAVVRYNPNGSLDTSFDLDGIQTTAVGPYGDEANAVAIQPDGKIVVVGYANNVTDEDIVVVRYNRNGSLDATFGLGGIATLGIGASSDRATAVAIQGDGKIVVAGYFFNGLNDDMAVVRYNSNGSRDTTFDSDGIQTTTTQLGSVHDRANALAIQSGGKILVAGYQVNVNDDTTLVRYNPNGSLDTTFGTGGIHYRNFGGADRANGIAVRPDGVIVAVGYLSIPDPTLLVVRYPANGSSEDDAYPYVVNHPGVVATGVALQPDGKILASVQGDPVGWAVARLMPDGRPDGSFGSVDGLAHGDYISNAVAVTHTGKIAAAGVTKFESTDDFAVARYLGDLTPPWGARMIGVPRYSLPKRRIVSWAASDTGTGVKSFDVQRRRATYDASKYNPWSTWLSNTSNVYRTFTGGPGATYCLRVRGRDFAGNIGVYSPPSCEAIPLDERSMSATGSWTNLSGSSYYLGTAMSSSTAGATLQVAAKYRHLAVVVTTCPGCGSLRVFRGTTLLREINLSATTVHRKIIEVASSLTVQSGTIRVRQSSAGKAVIVEGLAVSLA